MRRGSIGCTLFALNRASRYNSHGSYNSREDIQTGSMDNVRPLRHLLTGIAFLLVVMVVGVVGFHAIEGWSLLDSVYMTVITLTTVGYGEVHPLSDNGKQRSTVVRGCRRSKVAAILRLAG